MTIQARLRAGAFVGGGLSTGRTATNNCFAKERPDLTPSAPPGGFYGQRRLRTDAFCDVVPPWSANTQVKLNGAYPLPWDMSVSGVFQSLPGIPITASYLATAAEIARLLGRSPSGSVQSVLIADIIPTSTEFEDRIVQLDLRFTKKLRVGRARIEGNVDLYNVFNSSSILVTNARFGSAWLTPTQVLGGRLFKLGFQVNF